MKKSYFITSLFTFSIISLIMACSSKDDNTIKSENTSFMFIATLESKQNVGTRSLTPSGNSLSASWQLDEGLAVIYNGKRYSAYIKSITDGKATITATIDNAIDGADVKLIYPAEAVDYSATDINEFYTRLQDGTLTDISSKYDICIGEGILHVDGTTATLKNSVRMEEQNAICKFVFTDGVSEIAGIKSFHIYNSTGDIEILVDNVNGLDDVWVSMKPTEEKKNFCIITGDGNFYTGTAKPSIFAGKYYEATLKITKDNTIRKLEEARYSDVGKIVAADGNIYPVGTEGITPLAMVAYVGNVDGICEHGLALSLNTTSATQYNATSNIDINTTEITGGTWRLPTILDYQYMFKGCGGYTPITPVSEIGSSTKFSTGHIDDMLKIIASNASLNKSSDGGVYWTNTLHYYDSPVYRYWCLSKQWNDVALFRSGEDYSNSHYVRYCLSF